MHQTTTDKPERAKTATYIARIMIGLFVLVGVFMAVAFLPGSIEGNYRGKLAPTCACDSINFLRFRSGKVVLYSTDHSPADLFGRYERSSDGSIQVLLLPSDSEKKEKLWFKSYPRLLITKFVMPDGRVTWCWKWPLLGDMRKAVGKHQIKSWFREGELIRIKYFNSEFEVLRTESKSVKK